tara:strand:+ start:58 stop:1857 length:1800 start_codon:yes stop_codon:yes gene_type:complete
MRIILPILLLIFSCDEVLDNLNPDTIAPTVLITYPVNETTLTSTTTIKADVTDDSDISSVKFLIDGTEAYADTTAPYEYEWDVCVLGTGSHSVLVKAEDSASNKGQSDISTFTLDASYDCADVCGGDKLLDNCNVCDADAANDCPTDCNGDWGGSAYTDECDDCVGGNTALTACLQDDCGVWGGANSPNTGTCDCASTPNGTATIDNCNICTGGTTTLTSCAQDDCGIWGGDGFDNENYWCSDIAVLNEIISLNALNYQYNEFGNQDWENGRLITLRLDILHINEDIITTLPESLGNLDSLENLYITHQLITEIPNTIGNLTNLSSFAFYDNPQLTSIPESIVDLTNLTYLNVARCSLGTIPENIGNLSNLTTLDFGNNNLTTIPTSICNIPDDCEITVFGNNLCDEFHYSCIDWWETGVASQDQSNCDCLGITGGNAVLDDCTINDLSVLQNIINLNNLNVEPLELGCTFSGWEMFNQVWEDGRLIELHLYGSLSWGICQNGDFEGEISVLPESIGNITELERLTVHGTQITSFPESITNLTNLIELDANQNQLTSLPNNICSLPNLSELYVSSNNLCEEYHYNCIDNWGTQDQSNCP